VRELYESNREPELGGALREATVLFSDIRGFTAIAERLSPADLARALGCYFDRMTRAIQATRGIVDKFIGDSVMALWNVPGLCPGHPAAACRAALACIRETETLYASPDWRGLPPLVTRFGIHVDTVFVGHFGAPSRLSYTALGDGVNLASRLEELCKQYGVVTLVSDAVEERARDEIAFRLVDRVVVKGKTTAVTVYEILSAVNEPIENDAAVRAYERAFEAYARRAFSEALALLQSSENDGPSRVLADRCARYIEHPPPPEWDGTFHADHK
jgi:adenylate cyclase